MRNLWHRLLVWLGLRKKARVYHAGKAKLSIRRSDGTWAEIGIITNVSYGNTHDVEPSYVLGPANKHYVAGKQEAK